MVSISNARYFIKEGEGKQKEYFVKDWRNMRKGAWRGGIQGSTIQRSMKDISDLATAKSLESF